jgi:putative transposase
MTPVYGRFRAALQARRFTPGSTERIVALAHVSMEPRPVHGPSRGEGFSPFLAPGGIVMSRNYYSEINLHIVWHTKDSAPLLLRDVEQYTHCWIKQVLINTNGVYIHAIGGTENHIHLAVEIAPTITISEWIGQLKGASSHEANQHFGDRGKVLQWQTGYGVVTYGAGDRDWVCRYIRNQRAYHAGGKIHNRLERITHPED